jgi:hypothetical protein
VDVGPKELKIETGKKDGDAQGQAGGTQPAEKDGTGDKSSDKITGEKQGSGEKQGGGEKQGSASPKRLMTVMSRLSVSSPDIRAKRGSAVLTSVAAASRFGSTTFRSRLGISSSSKSKNGGDDGGGGDSGDSGEGGSGE